MKNAISKIFKPVAYTLLVSGVLFSASCSSSSHDEPQQEQATSNSKQTVSIPLQAEVELDESARSLIYKVGKDGSFQYNLKDGTIKLFTTIRNSQPDKAQYSGVLDWTVDATNNRLLLKQTVNISDELAKAMEQGTWYASAAFSPVNTTEYPLSGMSGSGRTATNQAFGYGGGSKPQGVGIYEGINPSVSHITPAKTIGHVPVSYDGLGYDTKSTLDHIGPTVGETEKPVPTIYILPWTKVSITGTTSEGRYGVDGSSSGTIYHKVVKFSGTLKPVGSVVRVKVEMEPATFEMKNGSNDIADVKEYVEDATWALEKIQIRSLKHYGYYDFSSGAISAGQLPPHVSTGTTSTEELVVKPSHTLRLFNAPKAELGYFYYWTPDDSFSIGYQLYHPYRDGLSKSDGNVGPYLDGPTVKKAGTIYSDFFGYVTVGSDIKLPVYSSKIAGDTQAVAKWNRLYNKNPYSFNCQYVYPQKTVSVKQGHTKVITLKIKPEVKQAERHPIKEHYYNAV